MIFSSRYIEEAVQEFAKLPGVGKKTALRLVLHLLKAESSTTDRLAHALMTMKSEIKVCKICHNYSDMDICNICNSMNRKKKTICVVESVREVIAIENTGQYNGVYHVLGGVISPIDGIGPEKLNIESLVNRVKAEQTEELIMALNPTIEGDTSIFYITKKMSDLPVKISTISRGIAFGSELEYTDETTLARSIATRLPYKIHDELSPN